MAELTIAQLTELLAANVDNADLLPIWDDTASETKKITISNFRTAVGVSNWSESFSSATQATSRWIPNNAATNVNAAIVPKGNGAIVAAIPDGTATGGNARGTYAVDLQMQRANAIEISGNSSVIVGGANNRSLGNNCFVGGGTNNRIYDFNQPTIVAGPNNGVVVGGNNNWIASESTASSAEYSVIVGGNTNRIQKGSNSTIVGGASNTINSSGSFIGGGTSNTVSSPSTNNNAVIVGGASNTASAPHSFVGGGQSNTTSATHTTVSGGQSNTASGSYSMVIGGLSANSNLYGQSAHASGQFSAQGDAQSHELIWRREITGTAQTELFLDGASVAAILPATNTVWHGIIDITSICTVAGAGTTVVGDVAATSYKATIKRLNTNTSLVGTVQEIGSINANTSMAAVAFTINANDTNESLRILFTPPPTAAANTVIRVVATFRGTQIKY
jgi:hypothetical protein